MGIRETGSYNTVGQAESSESAESSGSFLPNRWLGQLRNSIEQHGEEGQSRWDRIAGPLSRSTSDCCTEQLPSFVRGLAAGSQRNLIVLLVFLLCAFTIVHYLLQPPSDTMQNLVPAPSVCSSQDDMYDTDSRLCRVGNKYAIWYLRHKDWIQCAPNVPGYRVLQQTGPDWNGHYWYGITHSKAVREFYDTCIPECATDEDTFHIDKDMCLVTDDVLITWMNGDGQKCPTSTIGEKSIRWATGSLPDPQGRYWYAPDSADKVRALLESCHSTCAQSDVLLHDNTHCQVMNTMALHFLTQKTGSCDTQLPGFSAISGMGITKDVTGAFMYPQVMGGSVETFYLSCMDGWDSARFAGAVPHSSETVKSQSLHDDAANSQHRADQREWDEAMSMSVPS
mmetsp:Transcript_13507/g.28796  ORF Transcript_13507/g.28796 Transcript_13507/m.28796 type:complete len:395 (-) Transcript_13507:92-1276(-)